MFSAIIFVSLLRKVHVLSDLPADAKMIVLEHVAQHNPGVGLWICLSIPIKDGHVVWRRLNQDEAAKFIRGELYEHEMAIAAPETTFQIVEIPEGKVLGKITVPTDKLPDLDKRAVALWVAENDYSSPDCMVRAFPDWWEKPQIKSSSQFIGERMGLFIIHDPTVPYSGILIPNITPILCTEISMEDSQCY